MARNYGSLSIVDTLRSITGATIIEYGIDNLYANMTKLLDAHNLMTADILGTFASRTKDKQRRYGGSALGVGGFQELSETGIPRPQKTAVTGVDVGFPLRRFGRATQWTALYWKTKTPADFIKEMQAVLFDDVYNIEAQLRRALFWSANNLSYIDRFDNKVTLPVRAMLNADGADIPADRFGNAFNGATHNHYLATASLTAANVDALVNTLIEHDLGPGERVLIYINRNDQTSFGALTGFKEYPQTLLQPGGGSTATVQLGGTHDDYAIDDVAIGRWDGFVEVWLKPWVPAGYILAFVTGSDTDEILQWREPWWGSGDLELFYEHEHSPMTANAWERYMGIGVYVRHKGAVLYTGGASYVNPTITFPV